MSLGPGEAGESRSIPALSRRLPIPPTLSGYRRSWLPRDVLAGLTVWAVLVPESLAYATIAGVSPVVGLYAAAPALVFYALLGSSRQLVVGPMSATAALSAAAVGTVAASGSSDFVTLTAALAITTGIAALLAGVLRSGVRRVVHFRAGAEGLHHRNRPDHHRGSAPEAVRSRRRLG